MDFPNAKPGDFFLRQKNCAPAAGHRGKVESDLDNRGALPAFAQGFGAPDRESRANGFDSSLGKARHSLGDLGETRPRAMFPGKSTLAEICRLARLRQGYGESPCERRPIRSSRIL